MCGIFGLIGEANPKLGARAGRCLHHRGPDDHGVWTATRGIPVTLANTRLSIIDLSPAGHMPMTTDDEALAIAYNGEVYNFAEIRAELERKGYGFRSKSDTEVVLKAYREWGDAFVIRLRGMFAFMIWDSKRQRLFAARDRMAIKPLYWAETTLGLALASELKAFVETDIVQPKINCAAVHHYLSFFSVPPPLTMIEGVHALMPGHSLIWEAGQVTTQQYWKLPTDNPIPMDAVESRVELRRLLEESIRLRMIADVPVGAFLSGGVDSSAVVALMTRSSGERLKTFSIGFEEGAGAIDERSFAQLVAQKYETEHSEVVVTGRMVADKLNHFIRGMDQPTGDGLNTYLVSDATAQHVKVALSGLGGDELFAGYPQFHWLYRAEQLQGVWSRLPRWGRSMAHYGAPIAAHYLQRPAIGELPNWLDAPFLERYSRVRTLFGENAKYVLYSSEFRSQTRSIEATFEILRPYYLNGEHETIDQITRLEMHGYMTHTLLRDTDAMSMAHSLEVRVPLLDHKLVEFAVQVPAKLKLRNGRGKRLLTEALYDLLPTEILNRKKQGFNIPVGSWLQAELRPVVEDTLSRHYVAARGLFEPDAIDAIYRDFQSGNGPYMRVWALVVLELWQREFLD